MVVGEGDVNRGGGGTLQQPDKGSTSISAEEYMFVNPTYELITVGDVVVDRGGEDALQQPDEDSTRASVVEEHELLNQEFPLNTNGAYGLTDASRDQRHTEGGETVVIITTDVNVSYELTDVGEGVMNKGVGDTPQQPDKDSTSTIAEECEFPNCECPLNTNSAYGQTAMTRNQKHTARGETAGLITTDVNAAYELTAVGDVVVNGERGAALQQRDKVHTSASDVEEYEFPYQECSLDTNSAYGLTAASRNQSHTAGRETVGLITTDANAAYEFTVVGGVVDREGGGTLQQPDKDSTSACAVEEYEFPNQECPLNSNAAYGLTAVSRNQRHTARGEAGCVQQRFEGGGHYTVEKQINYHDDDLVFALPNVAYNNITA